MKKKIAVITCCCLLLMSAAVFAEDRSPGTGKAATLKESTKAYPLQTCIVTGQPLDSMGGPVEFAYKGHTFLLCCMHCSNAIKAEPDTYIRKLADAGKKKAAVHE